jgi:hypothetical protein
MENNESAITKQAVAQLVEIPLAHKIDQPTVAQLVTIVWSDNINPHFMLTQRAFKTIILGNTPAKPMEFDSSNFMLKLCGFSFFSALLIPLFIKNSFSTLSHNQWRLL